MSIILHEASNHHFQLSLILDLARGFQTDRDVVNDMATDIKSLADDARGIYYHLLENCKLKRTANQKKVILEWLSSAQQSTKHREISSKRLTGTGEWLLDSPAFQEWLNHSNNILCCTGDPGVGKSMLTYDY